MEIIDAHCHLQDARLGLKRDQELDAALSAGICGFCCCGTSPSDWPVVRHLAVASCAIIPAYGLHPWYVAEAFDDWPRSLRAFLEADPRAAIGETGLDRSRAHRNDDAQATALNHHLTLARELERPVILHCVRAWGPLLQHLEQIKPCPRGFLLHGFSGSAELIPQLVKYGGWFSVGASIMNEQHVKARQRAAAIPIDRLLVESDAPDGLDSPAHLPALVEELAALRHVQPDALADILLENAHRFFNR